MGKIANGSKRPVGHKYLIPLPSYLLLFPYPKMKPFGLASIWKPIRSRFNTQQLQDFDNVYIQLYNDNWSVKAGDVVLANTKSNFLRYYKNVQGGQFSSTYALKNGFKAETSLAGSVAKGRFGSVSVQPIEGVQGPYRVQGPKNERFLIILVGSEKVFIDGKQLKRGYDQDYIIDYNLAEITFTNRVVITQFTRIRVDYEFSDHIAVSFFRRPISKVMSEFPLACTITLKKTIECSRLPLT